MPRRDEEMDTAIGVRIRKARAAKGIAQAALGRELGRKSSASMYKCEQGKSGLPPHELAKIAHRLDVSLDWLINGHERAGRDPELSEAERDELFEHYFATQEEQTMVEDHLRIHPYIRITSGYLTGFLHGLRATRAHSRRS